MALHFSPSNTHSPNRYFMYLNAGKIVKTFFVNHPILRFVLELAAYLVLRRAGVDFSKIAKLGGKLIQLHRRINAAVVHFENGLSQTDREFLEKTLGVTFEQVTEVTACLDTSAKQTFVSDVWLTGYEGSGVVVAVLDSGINDTHTDLKNKVVARKDFTNELKLPLKTVFDPVGHGTHCAGAIAGNGKVYRGMAPRALLIDARVLNSRGNGATDSIVKAMSWAASQGADVISMSLGGPGNANDAISREANALASEGIVVVVAAGNEGPGANTIGSPGAAEKVITVGAVDKQNTVTKYSSRGPVIHPVTKSNLNKPDVLAPGGGTSRTSFCVYSNGITSVKSMDARQTACTTTENNVKYEKMSGTSMATPQVAGICALLLEAGKLGKNRKDRCQVIKDLLISTAKNLSLPKAVQGAGLVDALAALRKLTNT